MPIAGTVWSPQMRLRPSSVVWLVTLNVTAAFTAACASTGGSPKPFPVPSSRDTSARTAIAEPRSFDVYALTGTALALRGVRYRSGGADPKGFDCSGFTQYVFSQYGVPLPRAVHEQFHLGQPVKSTEVEAGDLLFFSTSGRGASHVGIAIGPDQFIHAPSASGVVRIERMSATYWSQRYIGTRRLR
jgi:cell wall-associated NlpC family hydrolase